MRREFKFPPSVQSDLFNYLSLAQQEILKPVLRIMKRPYQVQLCSSLLDYMEGNGLQHIDDPLLNILQHNIIEECEMHPLTC